MYHSGFAINTPPPPYPHPLAMHGLAFTDECRRVLIRAGDNAVEHGDALVEPTHLLYGIARENRSVAAATLADLGAELEDLLLLAGGPVAEVTDDEPRGLLGRLFRRPKKPAPSAARDKPPDGNTVAFSPTAKRAIDLAVADARALKDQEVDSGHLLVALLQLNNDRAAALLSSAGAELDRARPAVARRRAQR
jgi:ATP-dependent Clp protease ATP-binding subunit ClpC